MEKFSFDIGDVFLGAGHPLARISGVSRLVSIVVANAIVIAGVVFIFLLIFGGISMISGAGSGDPQRVQKGKDIVAAAVIGFIIVIAAWFIVRVIERATGLSILT